MVQELNSHAANHFAVDRCGGWSAVMPLFVILSFELRQVLSFSFLRCVLHCSSSYLRKFIYLSKRLLLSSCSQTLLAYPPKAGFSPLLSVLQTVFFFGTGAATFFGVQEFETELKPWKFFSHNGGVVDSQILSRVKFSWRSLRACVEL